LTADIKPFYMRFLTKLMNHSITIPTYLRHKEISWLVYIRDSQGFVMQYR